MFHLAQYLWHHTVVLASLQVLGGVFNLGMMTTWRRQGHWEQRRGWLWGSAYFWSSF